MALRVFSEVPYLPVLSLRPAEMRALEELPDITKDRILPLVPLRPWTTAKLLEKGLERLQEAYPDRPLIVSVSDPETIDKIRPVHGQLDILRHPEDGYRNWCGFIVENPNFIPALQLHDVRQLTGQLERLYALGRGVVVVIENEALPALKPIVEQVRRTVDGGDDICFVIDLGFGWTDPLARAVVVGGLCKTVWDACANAAVALSASSFPPDFKGRFEQEIYERSLFNAVRQIYKGRPLIYSDRGSARFERQAGGGGKPAPRIDYPYANLWRFYRSDLEGFEGYQEQADLLINTPGGFDRDLRIWGTQMIERTAAFDQFAISSPARSTAVRINLHLHKQAFYDEPMLMYDTDDDWEG